MGIYEAMLQAGGIFGLVLAGFITDRGWRWNLWVFSASDNEGK
jgi:MFS family permease